MNVTKKWLAVLIAIIMLLAAVACAGQTAQSSPAEAPALPTEEVQTETPAEEAAKEEEPSDTFVTLTDMMGHEIVLDKPAERIVALSAADCEIVYALGAGEHKAQSKLVVYLIVSVGIQHRVHAPAYRLEP